ncbi:GvpL/GvpF family gas vesicle protein [Kitasatospora saccharophila]|uniref:GvpL/GvpF family gas vesicle protein n=1 Tax=Kitasatospora saccharophila TaxID=407973 RepID=A0ABN2WA10_9ACTN
MSATPPQAACYVYGIVPSGTRPPEAAGVGDPPAPVTLVSHHGVAALVGEIDVRRPLGTPRDLIGHARVLDEVAAARTPVLPFRFGAVVRDTAAVTDELLAPQEQRFLAALEDLDGLAQFTARATYRQDRVLREIVAHRPDIARLREEVAELPEAASRPRRIRLGELVAEALVARGRSDTDHLVAELGPLAAATSRAESTADQPATVSFLVAADRWSAFERAADALAADWDGRVDFRLIGPLAPYDFAPQLVDAQGPGSWD